jgi:hypothetical protein
VARRWRKKVKDKTIFRNLIGTSIESRILEYLMETREQSFSFNDITKNVGLNRKRAYSILKLYSEERIIIPKVQVKHITLYKLNLKDSRVKLLIKLFNSCLRKETQKENKDGN